MKARWWSQEEGAVRCELCPHRCRLAVGRMGVCGIRRGGRNTMELPGYGIITAEALDPVEKKPLYHFHPGRAVWSMGFAGCNLRCPFCQNHRIARAPAGTGQPAAPEEIIGRAGSHRAAMLAYTYSEPGIHGEYLLATAEQAREAGLKNVLVTNGCLNAEPAKEILSAMDAVNVDVKSWNKAYYRSVLGGDLAAVRKFVELAAEECWVEATTLIVPGDTDDDATIEGISRWLSTLSPNIPLHLSAYHPAHLYRRPPTSAETVARLASIAGQWLRFVYVGNLGWNNPTLCPECQFPVIERHAYRVECHLVEGCCPQCRRPLAGVFPPD